MKSKKSVESFFDKLFSAIQISLNEAAKIGNLEREEKRQNKAREARRVS
jgi:hypothetical protein